jgi:hypothetical protein
VFEVSIWVKTDGLEPLHLEVISAPTWKHTLEFVGKGPFSGRSGNENGASDTRGDFAESELYKLLIAIE